MPPRAPAARATRLFAGDRVARVGVEALRAAAVQQLAQDRRLQARQPQAPQAVGAATARAMSSGDAPEKPTIWRRVLMTSVGFRIAETTAVETPPHATSNATVVADIFL